MSINNYFKCKRIKSLIKKKTPKHRISWLDKSQPILCCLQETHFRSNHTHRVKLKECKKIFHANKMKGKSGYQYSLQTI